MKILTVPIDTTKEQKQIARLSRDYDVIHDDMRYTLSVMVSTNRGVKQQYTVSLPATDTRHGDNLKTIGVLLEAMGKALQKKYRK